MALEAFVRPERGSDPPSGIRRRSDLLARRSELTLLAEGAQNSSNLRELERLIVRLAPAVQRTCRGVLGAGHSDFEDVAQDCLLEILRALPNYRFQGDFLHYTNKICLRVALLAKRRERDRSRRSEPLESFVREPPGATANELDRARALRRVLLRMPRAQAEALSLHFVAGYSVEEAAELTRVSPNTVKTRIRLGKRRLRNKLRGFGAETPARESC
ncbi:MAG TPA: RNA polymerase sigma factor [Polyangiaceae bacterium]|nr:RNA polymerase sigma factor [Polyangiaceae bacterium]